MELHQIRYFLALCDELNFTRAAERCEVAQSSLTRAIRSLELELGGPLFHRERANTHLSKLGEKVKPFLEQAFGHVQGAKRQAQEFFHAQTSSLRLGLMCTIAPARVIELVGAMRAREPAITLQLSEADGATLQEWLLGGTLDAAIYALPSLPADERLNHLPLYREPFAAVLQAAHRLAPRGFLRLDDLEGEPYLHRVHCEHEALSHRALSAPVFESDRDDWILAMAAAGLGFGLIPAHSADYPGTVALRLAAPAIAREISLVTPRARPHPPAVGALVHEAMRLAAMPEAVAPAAEPVLLEAVAAQ